MTNGGLKLKKLNRLVLGCIEAKFCKKILVGKLSPRSTQCTPLHSLDSFAQLTPYTPLHTFHTSSAQPRYDVLAAAIFAQGRGGERDMISYLLDRRADTTR